MPATSFLASPARPDQPLLPFVRPRDLCPVRTPAPRRVRTHRAAAPRRPRPRPDARGQLFIPWFVVPSPVPPPPRPKARRPARLAHDPDRYIRQVKGGKYQARPCDLGERYNLGLFHTKAQARKAIDDFWWGRYPDRPRFVKRVRGKGGDWFLACVPVDGRNVCVGGQWPTEAAAHEAAVRFVRKTFGAKRAKEVLKRK